MKFINKLFLLVVLLAVISTTLLRLFSAGEYESRDSRLVQMNNQHQVLSTATSTSSEEFAMPDVMTFLPNLLTNPYHKNGSAGVKSPLKVSKNRRKVDLVIAIPSVKRNTSNYLNLTLKSLLSVTTDDEKRHILIIVLLSDLSAETVKIRYDDLYAEFKQEIDSGLIEIVSPSLSFYPDFEQIKLTLGDPADRVKWRTKQALDYAYLMMYAVNRCEYFLQLEDDVIAATMFSTKVIAFAKYQDSHDPDWIFIHFSSLGYIGKLFHNRDLLSFSVFYMLFHATKPVDWLLLQYVAVRVCPHVENTPPTNECRDSMKKAILNYSPPLFQHTGYYSSLSGKVQEIQEHEFEKDSDLKANPNPPADLTTSLKAYESNTLEILYEGAGNLWVYPPLIGDYIEVNLSPPIALRRFHVVSGLSNAPSDLLLGAKFEVKPLNITASMKMRSNGTLPGYFVLSSFDERGQVNGSVPAVYGVIQAIRVSIFKNHTNWVAISTFQLVP